MLKESVTRMCLGHQIAPLPSNPIKMQQFLIAFHRLSAWPLSLFGGTGGLLAPVTSGPSEQVLLSAPPWPVLGLVPSMQSVLACSHPAAGNDFQMGQGHFELLTPRVEGFLSLCLPSGPNICELALFRTRLQALKNTHTALSGGLGFSSSHNLLHYYVPLQLLTQPQLALCQHSKSQVLNVCLSSCLSSTFAVSVMLSLHGLSKVESKSIICPSLQIRNCCRLQFGLALSLPQLCFIYV